MNTSQLKTFAQETRAKLVSLVGTKLNYVLTADTAELRGNASEVERLRKMVDERGRDIVVEEVAYTWFNRVMALRFMDANEYNTPKVVSSAQGSNRPEILQDALSGSVSDDLRLSAEDMQLPEGQLYRKLLVASCNYLSVAMPFLFEPIIDYTELLLPDDLLSGQSFVTDIRRGMTDQDCQNVEVMGWLYQFYITDRKADAEAKKSKKGGLKSDEQAAATQLFTPHWIVRYMVENSLGRIWMTLHPESELRKQMPYYIDSPEGQTDTIPEHIHEAKDIRFLDPCMGSGHVLVYAFDLLTKMYEEEGYSTREIPAAILTNNLFGIDIDHRCYQLASFALTMKARAYHNRYLRRPVYPKVIALEPISHEVLEMSGNWEKGSSMWQFENIDTIGSLLKITPDECAAITITEGLWAPEQRLLKEQAEYLSAKYDCVVTNPPYLGKGIGDTLKAYAILEYPNSKADTMTMFMEQGLNFCSNNGYMSMINMQSWMFLSSYEELRKNLLKDYIISSMLHLGPHTFDELSGEIVQNTTFVIQNTNLKGAETGYYYRLVDGKNCSTKEDLFLKGKEKIRFPFVQQSNFSKIPGTPMGYWGTTKQIEVFGIAPLLNTVCETKKGLATSDNNRFLKLWFEVSNSHSSVSNLQRRDCKWFPHNKGGEFRKWYGNNDYVINWENDGYEIKNFRTPEGKLASRPQNLSYNFKQAVTWSKIASGTFAARMCFGGYLFDDAAAICHHTQLPVLKQVIGFLNTKLSSIYLSLINPTLNIQIGDIGRTPILLGNEKIEKLVTGCISISKADWDAHETSWDFQRSPLLERMSDCGQNGADLDMLDPEEIAEIKATGKTPTDCHKLRDVVMAYKHHWERKFHELRRNEVELNQRFIDIYGLQDELTPEVPLNEITILQKGEISPEKSQPCDEDYKVIRDDDGTLRFVLVSRPALRWNDDVIIKQFISYLIGCFMGRYSVDRPGLIIASQNQDLAALGLEVDGMDNGIKSTIAIDDDSIVPIVEEEDFFPDDMAQRIEAAVRAVFGDKHHYENMRFIEKALGEDLRTYLFKDYYADHQAMYSVKSTRPIYWLFSSKMGDKRKRGYFKALVYMHRMKPDTLSKLHADYVHPYIEKIERQLAEAEDTALRDDLTAAQRKKARDLANTLADKVREVKAFEQELVKMASHRITIDLDDGVRINYPKFYPLVEPIKGLE